VKKIDGVVVLIPKDGRPWRPLIASLEKFSDDFMDFDRDQGAFERRAAIQ